MSQIMDDGVRCFSNLVQPFYHALMKKCGSLILGSDKEVDNAALFQLFVELMAVCRATGWFTFREDKPACLVVPACLWYSCIYIASIYTCFYILYCVYTEHLSGVKKLSELKEKLSFRMEMFLVTHINCVIE